MSNIDEDVLETVLNATPAITVSSLIIFGLTLSDWVYVFTILYTFIGICTMIKKHWIDPWLLEKEEKKIAIEQEENNNHEV